MRGVVKLSASPLVVPWNQINAKRKLQLCAMSIVHVDVGWVTESLSRNDAYALIIVFFFGGGTQLWSGGRRACRTCSYGPVYCDISTSCAHVYNGY